MSPNKIYVSDTGTTTRWYSRATLEAGTELPGRDVSRALWDLARAESRGFLGCWAVFVDFRYDGLDEALSEESRAHGGGWGRGQDVTYHRIVVDGQLVSDPSYPKSPPSWSGMREGYPCEIRVNFQGARCGYVTVPSGHPAHGKGYDGLDVDCHGGLTYAEADEGGWQFGFDCSHSFDAAHPEYEHGEDFRSRFDRDAEYRTEEYVIGEIEKVAQQLKAMEAVSLPPEPPK